MSEPDSTRRRRPPTIDLTATEIGTESPASATGSSQTADGGTRQGRSGPAAGNPAAGANTGARLWVPALAAAAGVILGAAVIFALSVSGVLFPQGSTPAPANSAMGAIATQLDKIQTQLQSRPADAAAAARLANVETQTKALSDSLAAINRRLDEIASAAQKAGRRADAAAATANGAAQNATTASAAAKTATQDANAASQAVKGAVQNSIERSDLDALAARIATLEDSIKALSAKTANSLAGAEDHAARAAVAASALRAAVERGAPYQVELAAMKSLGADQSVIAALQPFAAGGIPTDRALARELGQLTGSLQSTHQPSSAPDSGGGFLGRLESNARNLVQITPVGAPAAANPSSSPMSRVDADAANADIAAALADIAQLPQSAKTRLEPWVQKVTARNAAVAASRRIAADALAALTSVKTQ